MTTDYVSPGRFARFRSGGPTMSVIDIGIRTGDVICRWTTPERICTESISVELLEFSDRPFGDGIADFTSRMKDETHRRSFPKKGEPIVCRFEEPSVVG